MTTSHTIVLKDRFMALGLSKNLAGDLSSLVSRWIKGSGEAWTVKRLKNIKTSFLRFAAGETYELDYISNRVWKGNQVIPKGPFGELWKMSSLGEKEFYQALQGMMCYSAFISQQVTEEQWKKFHSSATRPDYGPSAKARIEALKPALIQTIHRLNLRVSKVVELQTFEEFVVTRSSQLTQGYVNREIKQFVESDTGMALWEEFPQYRDIFVSLGDRIDTRIRFDDYFGYHEPLRSDRTEDPVGKLGLTQEPGHKLRVFASPNIVHQCAMSRLKTQLFRLLQGAMWDCTYDQSRGTDWAQVQLSKGRKVYSIDLSDATNNFPLDIQLIILQGIGCKKEDVELFHRLSRCPWRIPQEARKTMRWSVGQPLGLGPSFASFALAHGVLVYTLARELGMSSTEAADSFRVLGDDVIIADAALARSYIQALQDLELPISWDKTLCSDLLAEFAGKIVTGCSVHSQLKWRHPSDRSFLDFVKVFGAKGYKFLTPRQQTVARFIELLPEFSGRNPHGIPFKTRWALQLAYNELSPERYRLYYPVQSRWAKYLMNMELPYLRPDLPSRQYIDGVGAWASAKASLYPGYLSRVQRDEEHIALRISKVTSAPLKVLKEVVTPELERQLKRNGYCTTALSGDPRGITPLEIIETKISKLRNVVDQLGLNNLVSVTARDPRQKIGVGQKRMKKEVSA